MNVSLLRTYRAPKTGNPVFVYKVSGSAADLEAYAQAQGEFHRVDDDGHPLWFTTRCIGDSGQLIITSKGNVVADMSRFDQAASLAAQYGGNFGEALANATVAQILGTSVPQASAAQSAPEAESQPKVESPSEDDEIIE
jgi:hypothetical protein